MKKRNFLFRISIVIFSGLIGLWITAIGDGITGIAGIDRIIAGIDLIILGITGTIDLTVTIGIMRGETIIHTFMYMDEEGVWVLIIIEVI